MQADDAPRRVDGVGGALAGGEPMPPPDPGAALGGVDLAHPGMSEPSAPEARAGLAAYDPEAWSDLFVAAAGASAALAGLVFVAVSINIERILQYEGLPERALQTVLLLLAS